jgi:uncharacterized membrane protein YgaE (UPF0421/DUF939 family)
MTILHLNRSALSSNFLYLIKCLIGVIICYVLYKDIPQYPFYWAIVSVVIVLSPEGSNRQAYDRMKANGLGCAVGICLYPIHLHNLLILCLGVILTICVGVALGITNTLRTALAALVIVTLQEEQAKHWYIALERVLCVVAGCVVAVLITLLFNVVVRKWEIKR